MALAGPPQATHSSRWPTAGMTPPSGEPGGPTAPRGPGVPLPGATGQGRHRLRPLMVPALALVPIVAAVAAYLLFFTGDSPDRLSLTAPSGQPSVPAAGPVAGDVTGRWKAAAGSVAGYRVREKLARLPAQSDGVGRTDAVAGEMTVRREEERLVADAIRMEVDVSRLRSDETMRDNRMRTMGLETARFPTATFAGTDPVSVPATVTQGTPVTVDLVGDLTIHGVTRRVTIPLQVRMTSGRAEVVGSLTFPMSDFGITPPNIGGFVTVDPDATLEFQLFLTQA